VKIRVYYEDTDVGGIVYHANYLKYCERARSEYFFQQGSVPSIEEGEFVVASIEAKFKSSAKLGDVLNVTTEVLEIKGSSLVLRQCVLKDGVLLFDMNLKLGFIKAGKIGRMSTQAQDHLAYLFATKLD
jgi:acyl-CoA thioester hydrolase